jgi:hypothetical protein
MGGNIFKSCAKIPTSCVSPTIQNFIKAIRLHELIPDKNLYHNIVGNMEGDFVGDIDIVLEARDFYNGIISESIFTDISPIKEDFQSSLTTYNKDLREIFTGKKEVKIINDKEKKVVSSKGLLKDIIEPRLVNFLSRLHFNVANALKDFYEAEIDSYSNLIHTLQQQISLESNKRAESKIQRLQCVKDDLIQEKNNGQEFSLIYLINEDFLAMNGVISFAFPIFSDNFTLYENEQGQKCFAQIDLLLGSEKWQKQYKNHQEKSENKNALRNVFLQSIVSTLSKISEKKFFFKLLKHFQTDNDNVLGHIKNLSENAEKHDKESYLIQDQIKLCRSNPSEENQKKIKDLEKSLRELEHNNFKTRYISVDPNHGILLTTVVFEYKNAKRLVSKYRKDKLKITDDLDIFIKCLFGEDQIIDSFSNLEKSFNSFLSLCDSGHFSVREKEDAKEKLKEYVIENDIEINEWLQTNLFS